MSFVGKFKKSKFLGQGYTLSLGVLMDMLNKQMPQISKAQFSYSHLRTIEMTTLPWTC